MLLVEIAQPNLQSIVQTVLQTLQSQGHDFKPQVKTDEESGEATFTVSVVNGREGGSDEHYQVSSKALNAVIDPLFRQFRSAGYQFSQPVGVPGTANENDRFTTMQMQFTVGLPQQQQQAPSVTPQMQQQAPQQ